MKEGSFRQDLWFRLNVISLILPPLRERKEDIPLLIEHILNNRVCRVKKKDPISLSDNALASLLAYDWPGNVRELENAIEFAVSFSPEQLIQVSNLPDWIRPPLPFSSKTTNNVTISLEENERILIQRTLSQTGGDKSRTAKLLGIGKTTLYRKLEKYRNDIPHQFVCPIAAPFGDKADHLSCPILNNKITKASD